MAERNKGKLQRVEEPLEVGLDRHQRRKRTIPAWCVDYGPWIVLGAFFLFVVIPIFVFRFGSEAPQNGAQDVPRLVVRDTPTKVWVEGSANQIRSVKVMVGNVGITQAMGVRVTVSIGERTFVLTGPERIASGKSDAFEGNVTGLVRSDADLKISISCSNCRGE
jgi:hypothetical protein